MAEVFDATDCRRVGLHEALTTGEDFCRVLQYAGGEVLPGRPLLWPADISEFNAAHGPLASAAAPDVDTHFVRDAIIGGFAGSVVKAGLYVYNASSYPAYAKHYIQKGESEPFWSVPSKPETFMPGAVHVITHFNPIYGHWLVEIFPKLFAIAHLARSGLVAPILLPASMPGYVRQTIGLVLPGYPVRTFDGDFETIRAERVILTGMQHRDYLFNPLFRPVLDAFVAPFRRSDSPRNLYISRSGLSGKFREAENAAELDEVAAGLGLTVIRPEDLPWTEQLRLFGSAQVIVGEYGSGLHNALFSPAGTKIVCLNFMNDVQSRIAQSFGQDVGYILDPDGKPRLFESGWQRTATYRIDVEEFRRRIKPLMD